MRRLLLLPIILTGCVWPGTSIEIQKDPETGAIHAELSRGWLAGPVDIQGEYTAPDGTHLEFRWKAEIDLEAAQSVAALQQANMARALELAAAAAKAAGGVP